MSDQMRRALARSAGDGDIDAARRLVALLERESRPGAQPAAFSGFEMIRSTSARGLVYVDARAHIGAGVNHNALIDRLAEAAGINQYVVTQSVIEPSNANDGSYFISVAFQEVPPLLQP